MSESPRSRWALFDVLAAQRRFIYLAVAVLSRTTWELERAAGEEGAKPHLDCARIFVPMATRRVRRNIRALRRNQDSRMRAIAEHALQTTDLGPETPTDS